MKDILNSSIRRFRQEHRRARRYTAMLLVLAMLTSLSVSWDLHQVGTALTTDPEYYCGLEEHVHTEDCYTRELVCGYEEGQVLSEGTAEAEPAAEPEPAPEPQVEVHHHTDACYQDVTTEEKVLTCGLEEDFHEHDQYCYDDEGNLICGHEPHIHDDDCYTTEEITERELVCGYEEGQEIPVEPAEDAESTEPSEETNEAATTSSEPVVHHHTDACYEEVLTCGLEEHTHTAACLANLNADVETTDDWDQYSVGLSNAWNDALVQVAQEQLGYAESERNYQLDESLGETLADAHRYTRYGAWYGNPYGAWDFMFVAFCQHYAGIPKTAIPQGSAKNMLLAQMDAMGFQYLVDGGEAAVPGDIVTYYNGASEETIGIVETVDDATLTVISGDVDGNVAEVTIARADVTYTILVDAAYAEYAGDDPIAVQPDGSPSSPVSTSYVGTFHDPDGNEVQNAGVTSVRLYVNKVDMTGASDLKLSSGDTVNLQYRYAFAENALSAGTKYVTYQLPDGLRLTAEQAQKAVYDIQQSHDGSSIVVGTLRVSESGLVTMEFNDNLRTNNPFSGVFNFDATVFINGDGESGTIQIPGASGNTTITVEKPKDLSVDKSMTGISEATGKTILSYKVNISTKLGWYDTIDLTDTLSNNADITGVYVPGTFRLKKKASDGTETEIAIQQPAAGQSSVTIVKEDGSKLDGLAVGEHYELTYDVEITHIGTPRGDVTFKNTISANNTVQDSHSQGLKDRIWKEGAFQPRGEHSGQIRWEIYIKNPYGGNLRGYTVSDTILNIQSTYASILGEVELYEWKSNDWTQNKKLKTFAANADAKGFTYDFDFDATASQYCFVYYTDAPMKADDSYDWVDNTASLHNPYTNDTFTHTVSLRPSRSAGIAKAATSKELIPIVGSDVLYQAGWKVTETLPLSLSGSYTITDTILPVQTNEKGKHYAHAAELQQELESSLILTRLDGGSTLTYTDLASDSTEGLALTIQYFDSADQPVDASDFTTEVTSFKVTLSTTGYSNVLRLNELELTYHTLVDTTGMEAGRKVQFRNTANGVYAHYDFTPQWDGVTLQKLVCDQTFGQGNQIPASVACTGSDYPGTYYENPTKAYDTMFQQDLDHVTYSDGQYLYYQLQLAGFDAATLSSSYTIADTLPEGLELDESYTPQAIMRLESSWWSQHTGDKDQTHFLDSLQHFSWSRDGQNLTFTISGLDELTSKHKTQLQRIAIIYRVRIRDAAFWRDPTENVKTYENTASCGTSTAASTVTVYRTAEKLVKKGTSIMADGKLPRVRYRVDINQGYEDLAPGSDTLSLTDVMTVTSQDGNATPDLASVQLDMSSIKLYEYPYYEGDQPVPTTQYRLSYTTSIDESSHAVIHTLNVDVPDQHGYVLVYDYVTDGLTNVTLSNSATLEGVRTAEDTATVYRLTGYASANQARLIVYKVDSLNATARLPGAVFRLTRYNKNTNTFENIENKDITRTTDSNGKLEISIGQNAFNDSDASDLTSISTDTLYRLEEITPPSGYAVGEGNEKYLYFLWRSQINADQDETEDAAWSNAVGTATGAELPDRNAQNLLILAYNSTVSTNVRNTRTELTLVKNWVNPTGQNTSAPDGVTEIQVELHRYPKNGKKADTDPDFCKTYTLRAADNWTVTIDSQDLDADCYYYAIEQGSVSYDVSYMYSGKSVSPAQDAVMGGGLILVTNKLKESTSYELPSTGGCGTAPYLTTGGLLMAAAALLLARRRRKER